MIACQECGSLPEDGCQMSLRPMRSIVGLKEGKKTALLTSHSFVWVVCRSVGCCLIVSQNIGPSSSILSLLTGSGSFQAQPTWGHQELNLDSSACKADALPLGKGDNFDSVYI